MRIPTSHPLIQGVWLTTFLVACGTAATRREDALWREYRGSATARPAARVSVGEASLDRGALVGAVLARNPELGAAREALRAVLAEVPQVSALDDPMLSYEIAPLSIVGDARFGQRVTVRQRVPFPGKRRRAAEAALAEADAASAEFVGVQLTLAAMASELFDDRYLVERALEINAQHRIQVDEIRRSAAAQYVTGHAAQQDPLQAELALAELDRDRLMLESERDQVIARLNGLLHRGLGEALPPPPAELALAFAPAGTSADLQQLALRQRPQRAAARARIRAAQAEAAAAVRASYPDLELMASYDSMWDMTAHQWMVGVMVEVPLQRGRRRAAVTQAEAATARMRFEDDGLIDEIRVDVDRAHRRVIEAAALIELHQQRLLPAARDRLAAARAGFTSAQNSFTAVVAAERDLREAELGLETARTELSRRRAALALAVGIVPGLDDGGAR